MTLGHTEDPEGEFRLLDLNHVLSAIVFQVARLDLEALRQTSNAGMHTSAFLLLSTTTANLKLVEQRSPKLSLSSLM